jgi:hypothetical protein
MREPTLHKIAIVVVAVALGSAVIVTDAGAAGGHAGGGGDGAMAGGRSSDGFGRGGFQHGRYGRDRGLAVPFGYYPYGYYGDSGSSSNNGCVSLDAYGCED